MKPFTHPLARDAQIWMTGGSLGSPQPVLVVITTIALSPDDPRHKPKSMERLTAALKGWIADHSGEVADFVLINRPKSWIGDKLG